MGDRPPGDGGPFTRSTQATVYYLPWTEGWDDTYGGRPTAIWSPEVQEGQVTGDSIEWLIDGPPDSIVAIEARSEPAGESGGPWTPFATNSLVEGVATVTDSNLDEHSQHYRAVMQGPPYTGRFSAMNHGWTQMDTDISEVLTFRIHTSPETPHHMRGSGSEGLGGARVGPRRVLNGSDLRPELAGGV